MLNQRQGPSVTPEQLKDHIVGATYTVLPNKRTTICQLTLQNEFTVEGYSACVDVSNFNKELGEEYSRQNAEAQIWPLLGYALAEKLSHVKKAGELSTDDAIFDCGNPKTYLGTKVVHAVPMNRLDYNILRGWKLPDNEDGSDEGYLVQYANNQDSNVEGFSGYVSWSPKHIFEEAYEIVETPRPSTHVERMEVESLELHEKINRLKVFTQGSIFEKLSDADQEDLHNQLSAMKLYVEILDRRIDRAKSK